MNAGARLIFHANRREHVTPLLRQLHWLRIPDHFQTGDTDVPMRQRDCFWLPISGRKTSCRRTRPQTPMISCIIFTCRSSYLMFYNWWSRLRRRSRLCLKQTSPRNQICHITTCFQTSTEISSFRLHLTLVKWLKFFLENIVTVI